MTRSTWAILFGILLVGTLIRLQRHDVKVFSRADETVYLLYAKRLSAEGIRAYPDVVQGYLGNQQEWIFPPPLRFGYLLPVGLACKASSACAHRTLAWVSTLAGVLALVATFLLVRELVDVPVALVATALSTTSPLQLALGRRALSDEVFCAAALFALWALVRAVRAPPPGIVQRYTAAVLLSAFALAVKETAILLAPAALAAVFILRGQRFQRRDVLLFILPPLVAYLSFSLLAHSPSAAFEILHAERVGTIGASYVEQHNSGPPHRILADMFLLSPLSCLYAMAAVTLGIFSWKDVTPGVRSLLLLLALTLIAVSVVAVKNVRYAISSDGLVRALGAWFLVARVGGGRPMGSYVAIALGGACVVTDYLVFHRVFVAGGVYDPVTAEIVRALKLAP